MKDFLDSTSIRYIKEFVHGDFRRTCPSLGTLLETEVDIVELDVQVSHFNSFKINRHSLTNFTVRYE